MLSKQAIDLMNGNLSELEGHIVSVNIYIGFTINKNWETIDFKFFHKRLKNFEKEIIPITSADGFITGNNCLVAIKTVYINAWVKDAMQFTNQIFYKAKELAELYEMTLTSMGDLEVFTE